MIGCSLKYYQFCDGLLLFLEVWTNGFHSQSIRSECSWQKICFHYFSMSNFATSSTNLKSLLCKFKQKTNKVLRPISFSVRTTRMHTMAASLWLLCMFYQTLFAHKPLLSHCIPPLQSLKCPCKPSRILIAGIIDRFGRHDWRWIVISHNLCWLVSLLTTVWESCLDSSMWSRLDSVGLNRAKTLIVSVD